MSESEKILIQIHPRAFSAFGEDLITNELVAITELVKNCYDAYAFKVSIEFGKDGQGETYIKITDDGLGMSRDVILNAWATIATPYKKKNPIVKRMVNGEERIRKVSGNKGLGRFSAARLGNELHMVTKSSDGKCLKVFFDWTSFEDIENIKDCYMTLEEMNTQIFKDTGTVITLRRLKEEWKEGKIRQLSSELSRLISPFENVSDFAIEIDYYENVDGEPIKIEPEEFINNPIYKILGTVSKGGDIEYNYVFNHGSTVRVKNDRIDWEIDNYQERCYISGNSKMPTYTCGEFSFEIRLWDLDSDSIEDVSERFNIGKKDIRSSIKLYKGISVYRDNVLVLPKSETSRDWLGLDAKRISQIGKRISTSQIVGIVNISNENNPGIKDTTDREKLVDTNEYKQFVWILESIISVLQSERVIDRVDGKKHETLTDIITPLSAKPLLEKIESAISKGENTLKILSYVQNYEQLNEKQLIELNDRLVYYAQTASLGSVAIVIMHEFLTGMTSVKRFLNKVNIYKGHFDKRTKEYLVDAENSHERMIEVAESFSPLYKRDLRKNSNSCSLLDALEKSIRIISAKKISGDVKFNYNISKDIVALISMGELQTIFINLFDNACYWMKDTKSDNKLIEISIEDSEKDNRIFVAVSDTGCGILEENAEKIFIPGVTSKPKGIGMGLVITTELISSYKGTIGIRYPGDLLGATFIFDIPVKKG